MSPIEPIARYSEKTLTGKRRYELYPDKILIQGAVGVSHDYGLSVALNKLNPEYITLRTRPTVTWLALLTSLITGFASVLLVNEFAISSRAVPGVLGIYSGSALIIAIATFKKVEYARFCSDDYRTVLINVARSGPDQKHFDSFVKKLVDEIVKAKEAAQHTSSLG
jgi:hypothetical protein